MLCRGEGSAYGVMVSNYKTGAGLCNVALVFNRSAVQLVQFCRQSTSTNSELIICSALLKLFFFSDFIFLQEKDMRGLTQVT